MFNMCEDRMEVRLEDSDGNLRVESQQQNLVKISHQKTGIKTEPILVECDMGQSSKKDFEITNNYR